MTAHPLTEYFKTAGPYGRAAGAIAGLGGAAALGALGHHMYGEGSPVDSDQPVMGRHPWEGPDRPEHDLRALPSTPEPDMRTVPPLPPITDDARTRHLQTVDEARAAVERFRAAYPSIYGK